MIKATFYRICNICREKLSTERFSGKSKRCRSCNTSISANYVKTHPRYRLWASSRINARNSGVEHTIKVRHIPLPKTCRYLGCLLDYDSPRNNRRVWNRPSIDRIDPTKGYVPGNVQVISDLANRMKSNATVEQLVTFARGVLREHVDPPCQPKVFEYA